MVTEQLFNPSSIVVVGASSDLRKPGGKILKNLLDHSYAGALYAINPKLKEVLGVPSFASPHELPEVDLAILAIPASLCLETVGVLARTKNTKAFIIISAGFSEENEEGAKLEEQLVGILEETGSCLIGPNCIGVITTHYAGCFTTPIPQLDPAGVDFISGSGAVAVYVMEAAIPNGLRFSSVFSVGNSAQLAVEDILQYLDENFDPKHSSRIKLLYLESIRNPAKLLKHASSLIRKGCRIAAIKAGWSEAGSRAASSHTGALATADHAVNALFRKAGIVRCYSRGELAALGCLFSYKAMNGKRMAIITHAGGPAVMLTDLLSEGGMEVPHLKGPEVEELLKVLHPGSSAANPIDVLATGAEVQLEACIETVDKKLDQIDGMCVIFGSPGLFSMAPVYELLDRKIRSCNKPIYPILPSTINAAEEVRGFIARGHCNFPDEIVFGRALVQAAATHPPYHSDPENEHASADLIRKVIHRTESGYLDPQDIQEILDHAGINRVAEVVATTADEAAKMASGLGYPVVMKVVGPLHKTDVGGVRLNVADSEQVHQHFNSLMQISDAKAVLLQPMLKGTELFIGVNYEQGFGHMVYLGLGGIMIEVLKDVQSGLAPLSPAEARDLIRKLKGFKILEGVRGSSPTDLNAWIEMIVKVSRLVCIAPEIREMDLNPVIGMADQVVAVDARIRIEK